MYKECVVGRPRFEESDLKPTSGSNTLEGSWIRTFWEENEFVSSQFGLFLLLICKGSPIVKFFLKIPYILIHIAVQVKGNIYWKNGITGIS